MVALLSASAAWQAFEIRFIKRSMSEEVATTAKLLGDRSTAALEFFDAELARENLQSLQYSPDMVLACIYQKDGSFFAEYSAVLQELSGCASTWSAIPSGTYYSEGFLHVGMPIESMGDTQGYIYIRSSLNKIEKHIWEQLSTTILMVLAAAAIAYWLSSRLQRHISDPLVKVAEIAAMVELKSDYSIRAPGNGADELGRLVRAFNSMLDTIEEQNQRQVDAQEKLEEIVSERTRQLEAANKELESFSYSVSHDLRSPLRLIDGFSKMMLDDYEDKLDEDGVRSLRRIRHATERMGTLIEALLGLARINRCVPVVETVDLSEIGRQVVLQLREGNTDRKVDVQIDSELVVLGDPRLLRVALENLLGNAWKYSSKQSSARITFGRADYNGRQVFYVQDNGVGFDMKYAGKLFGEFQRLHRADEFEGTGIGLATVARIIRRHNGRIWAESEPGKGAVFYFTVNDHELLER